MYILTIVSLDGKGKDMDLTKGRAGKGLSHKFTIGYSEFCMKRCCDYLPITKPPASHYSLFKNTSTLSVPSNAPISWQDWECKKVMKLLWLLRGSLAKSVSDRNPLDSFPGFYVLYERTSVGTERSSEEAPLHNETHISSRILN